MNVERLRRNGKTRNNIQMEFKVDERPDARARVCVCVCVCRLHLLSLLLRDDDGPVVSRTPRRIHTHTRRAHAIRVDPTTVQCALIDTIALVLEQIRAETPEQYPSADLPLCSNGNVNTKYPNDLNAAAQQISEILFTNSIMLCSVR